MKILIRRCTLLSLVALASYTLGASQTPAVADRVYTLDSLVTGSSEYYVPREITSEVLLRLLAGTPSLEAQLIDFYSRGGLDVLPDRSLLLTRLLMPRPWPTPPKTLMVRPRLSIEVSPERLGSLREQPQPRGEEYRREAALSLLGQFVASSVRLYPGYFSTEGNQPTQSLALATPSGESVERALENYVQDTKPAPIYLPEKRDYAELRERSWVPGLESTIQFSQNRVSDNWYKGGASNLNLYMRNYLSLSYIKDRVLWKNELESKLSIYNADKDLVHRYRIADDLLRLRSNYGIRAFHKIYYTLDGELRTQIFHSYQENKTSLQSDFFAPFTVNVGLGLKYDLTKKSTKVYGRLFHLSVNVAPLSYTYRGTSNRTSRPLPRQDLVPALRLDDPCQLGVEAQPLHDLELSPLLQYLLSGYRAGVGEYPRYGSDPILLYTAQSQPPLRRCRPSSQDVEQVPTVQRAPQLWLQLSPLIPPSPLSMSLPLPGYSGCTPSHSKIGDRLMSPVGVS